MAKWQGLRYGGVEESLVRELDPLHIPLLSFVMRTWDTRLFGE